MGESPESGSDSLNKWLAIAGSIVALLTFFGIANASQLQRVLSNSPQASPSPTPSRHLTFLMPTQSPSPTKTPTAAACSLEQSAYGTATNEAAGVGGDSSALATIWLVFYSAAENAANATSDTTLQDYIRNTAYDWQQYAYALKQGNTSEGAWFMQGFNEQHNVWNYCRNGS